LFWVCNEHIVHYKVQNMHNMDPKCVQASSIFCEEKMDWAKGRQGKKEAGSAKSTACNINYVHMY
jgi:hypothetical protein